MHQAQLVPKIPHILKEMYDADLLEEEVVISWAEKVGAGGRRGGPGPAWGTGGRRRGPGAGGRRGALPSGRVTVLTEYVFLRL